VPPEKGRGKDYSKGDWHFEAVRPLPPSLPPVRHPESPQS
jgi:hypothetical protein